MSVYQEIIKKELNKKDVLAHTHNLKIDPRHIEGYMRLMYSTLNHLSPEVFHEEVLIGIECIKADGIENAENNAKSFGL